MTTRKPRGTAQERAITPDLVRHALQFIPPSVGHDERARMAFAVFDGLGDAGEQLWKDWAGSRDDANTAEDRATWRSARKPGKTKIASLFGLAKDHGFRFPAADAAAPAPDPEALAAAAAQQRQRQTDEEAALQLRREDAARRCQVLWDSAKEEPARAGCPYLQRKGVGAHGLRFLPGGTALVPMRDADGRLWSVQRLLPKPLVEKTTDKATGEITTKAGTDKLYGPLKESPDELLSSRKLGLWHWIGAPASASVVLLAEGYATGASLHEATGLPVAVCFDAGNLAHVAPALRQLYPTALLLVCGDDDKGTEERKGRNPGRLAAAKAAEAGRTDAGPVGVVFPEGLPAGGKDFNDLHAAAGLQVVRQQIEEAIAAPAQPAPAPARQRRKSAHGGPDDAGEGARVQLAQSAAAGGPPAARAAAGVAAAGGADRLGFVVDESGVWHAKRDKDGELGKPVWLCAPLYVTARTRTDDSNAWGYLLEFADFDGNPKTWAMPSALLSGDGGEWSARLRDMGLDMAIGGGVRNLIGSYINTRQPEERITCTSTVGWHPGAVYVLPSTTIGPADARRYVFQSEGAVEDTFRQRGTLKDWQRDIAELCQGNSRLMFAVSCALAGPLLPFSGLEGGGFHFRGDSRGGKTTALLCAASVYGRESYMQQWRTTANALEGTAVQHNHALLVLDELGQLDPRDAGDTAYMLANGMDKGRLRQSILQRKRRTWQLLFLSSGEVGMADLMAEAGKRVRAGQEVRMVDVPLDAGAGMGGIEVLHHFEGPAELAEALKAGIRKSYGTAAVAWLQWCSANHRGLAARVRDMVERYRCELVPAGSSGQVRTVGSRFALVAVAGELAREAGITGWDEGSAAGAARRCFEAWLAARGHLDNGEELAMLRQVRSVLEKNGDALFTWSHRAMDDHRPNTALRMGLKRCVDEHGNPVKFDAAVEYLDKRSEPEDRVMQNALIEYLVLPEAFARDVCKGFDHKAVAKMLRGLGHLKTEADRLTIKQRIPGMGKVPVYHILPSIFDGAA